MVCSELSMKLPFDFNYHQRENALHFQLFPPHSVLLFSLVKTVWAVVRSFSYSVLFPFLLNVDVYISEMYFKSTKYLHCNIIHCH